MSILQQPEAPYIVIIALLLACAYAALVVWLNNHPRHGAFWRMHSWLEVVAGNSLIIATLWALDGLELALTVFALNALWGGPMVIAVLISTMRQMEREHEQIEAERIRSRQA